MEHGRGILKLEGKLIEGIWDKGILVEVFNGHENQFDKVVGKGMKKIPSLSLPPEDGVIIELPHTVDF